MGPDATFYETLISGTDHAFILWIAFAFVLGLLSRQIGLPPLVGFLAAGFALHGVGVESDETLEQLAETGVILLLFSIGLKLKVRSLLKPEAWAVGSIHMIVTTGVLTVGCYLLALSHLPVFDELGLGGSLVVAFALSFSSTVFAAKVLEDKGEMRAKHGVVAIGILIIQDIAAVVFLTVSKGEAPSPWALALLLLLPAQPLLFWIMDRCGHGELLVMFGITMALVVGAGLFELVGMKPDLGALILGVLLSKHRRAGELSNSLLSLKDVFLVGFFLNIGLSGEPSWSAAIAGVGLAVLAIPKSAFFYWLLTRFRLRARTALLSSLTLANFSEFGLIVSAIAVKEGWISADWLVVVAISMSATFVMAAPLNANAASIYARRSKLLKRIESSRHLPDDAPIDPGEAEVVVFGLGQLGRRAYDVMCGRVGAEKVVGVDINPDVVAESVAAGRRVILGDGADSDFWERIAAGGRGSASIRAVMLAMPAHDANLRTLQQVRKAGFTGLIAAVAAHPDQVERLEREGVVAYYFYDEAGEGFAHSVCGELGADKPAE